MAIWASITIIVVALLGMTAVVEGAFLRSLDVLAKRMRLPSSVAGATLLAFGTSAPEIATALVALFADGAHASTGVGSIVGSAIFQILVVVGFAATVRAATLDWRPVLRDGLFYALSVALLLAFVRDDRLTVLEAGALLGTYALYLALMWLWARNVDEPEPTPLEDAPTDASESVIDKVVRTATWPIKRTLRILPDPEQKPQWATVTFLVSLGCIGFACYWLVIAAEALANALSVPPAIIALTILAGGSSVPELVASATVSRQGRGDMAIANAIGSNVFDVLVSLGLPVFLYCLMYGDLVGLGGATIMSSTALLLATLVAVVALLALQRFRVGRSFGILLIAAYVVYVWAAYTGWID